MQKTKQRLYVVLPTIMLAMTAFMAPASAEHGSGDTTVASTTTTSSTTSGDSTSTDSTTPTRNSASELETQGQNNVDTLRKTHQKAQTADVREKKCELHKDGLTTKFASISTNAQRFQDKIDEVFTKTQKYVTDNNLTVTDYSTLVSNATDAQSASVAAIAAMKEVTPTIDCTKSTTATDVATFKAAAQQVRTDLFAYKKAVKALVKATLTASQAAKKASATTTTTDTTKTTGGTN